MIEYQSLTTNELEQAKEIAAAHWASINMATVTVSFMPVPSTAVWPTTDTVDTVEIIFIDRYSFAYFPLLGRLYIGKRANHNIIPNYR